MVVTHAWSSPTTFTLAASGWALLVHGRAGDVPRDEFEGRRQGCGRAVERGAAVLRGGGRALDAAQAAVEVLEDDPLFNAGTGACLNEEGLLELDASVMEGASLKAGAVCALPPFTHPIAVARAVLEDGRHALYAAEGAAAFAVKAGFTPSSHAVMTSENALLRFRHFSAGKITRDALGNTVGAVARDSDGHVAAATSTGGLLGKRRGRVGDSPVIGAGTYADDEAGAASCTGHGEGILRLCLAVNAIEAMRAGATPENAARHGIERLRAKVHTSGGIILLDRSGNAAFARSTPTMAWGALWNGAGSLLTGV